MDSLGEQTGAMPRAGAAGATLQGSGYGLTTVLSQWGPGTRAGGRFRLQFAGALLILATALGIFAGETLANQAPPDDATALPRETTAGMPSNPPVHPVLPAIPGWGAVCLLLLAAMGGHEGKRIHAGTRALADKDLTFFTLNLDQEKISLEPGKSWLQVDHYKWVVRGLIEAPQNFHVFPDGSVEINTEKIHPGDPDAVAKLEEQINKRHAPLTSHKPAAAGTPSPFAVGATSARPRFSVKLDHWGHLVIEWGEGIEKEQTGLRGLSTLVASGLIRRPGELHVDPLQRAIEIDGIRYECSEAGARQLEEALNTRYAVTGKRDKAVAIEIKENLAASTGFDIHFTIHKAGIPFEVKGHLTQENLDILQDPAKCDLLQPGIHLLLSPPYLLIRRRRPDLGEEKIPELPDVNLMRTNSMQLQQVLNHPLLRRVTDSANLSASAASGAPAAGLRELRVSRNPTDKLHLWLESVSASGETLPAKAFTQHNVADLEQSGAFLPHLEVHLSLDNRRLSVLNRQTQQEEVLPLDPSSPDAELVRASQLLTKSLRPAAPQTQTGPVAALNVEAAPLGLPAGTTPPVAIETPPAATQNAPVKAEPAQKAPEILEPVGAGPAGTGPDSATAVLFNETDAVRVNVEVFRHLETYLGLTAQEVHLSLPFVFENRRFEVLNFDRTEITSIMQLRGEDFYGFYLSHINEKKIVLVYACNGTHIEWGPDKCVLQPTVRAEAEEYKGSALLGMAQDCKDEFVFVVQPAFKQWIQPREAPYTVENVQFRVAADILRAPGDYRLIWPRPAAAPG